MPASRYAFFLRSASLFLYLNILNAHDRLLPHSLLGGWPSLRRLYKLNPSWLLVDPPWSTLSSDHRILFSTLDEGKPERFPRPTSTCDALDTIFWFVRFTVRRESARPCATDDSAQ